MKKKKNKSEVTRLKNALSAALFPYQQKWIADKSKYKVWLKSRQIGGSEAAAVEILLHAIAAPKGHDCYIVSQTQKNAIKILQRIVNKWIPLFTSCMPSLPWRSIDYLKAEIVLWNNRRIVAVPNDPASLRGNENCSYWFDECAFFAQRVMEQLEDACWPPVKNQLNKHGVIRAISSPWLKHNNLFHDICADPAFEYFSRHRTTIVDAVRDGYPFDIEYERNQLRREDTWQREYMCMFLTLGATFFDRDVLSALKSNVEQSGALYMGVDLAKVADFTSIVLMNANGYVVQSWTMKSVDYTKQKRIIFDLIDNLNPVRVGIDVQKHLSFGEELKEWCDVKGKPEYKRRIHGLQFKRDKKVSETEDIKTKVEKSEIRFNFDNHWIWDERVSSFKRDKIAQLLDDLSVVKQEVTPGGKQTFTVPRTAATGHGDAYSALLLANHVRKMKRVRRTRQPTVVYTHKNRLFG